MGCIQLILLAIIFSFCLFLDQSKVAYAADSCGGKCKPDEICSNGACYDTKCKPTTPYCNYKANNITYNEHSGHLVCPQAPKPNGGGCYVLPGCSVEQGSICSPNCNATRDRFACIDNIKYKVSDCDLNFGNGMGDPDGTCNQNTLNGPNNSITNLGPGAAGLPQLQQLFLRIINISIVLAFIALTVMLVFGGIKYIISAGEPKPLASANSTVTWAILGILFLALSWLGLQLLAKFMGVDFIGNFCLGFKPYCALNL